MSIRRLAENQPESFAFTPQNEAWLAKQIAKYPDGRQASAVVPALWQAQKQNDYWLPQKAIEAVADKLDLPYIRVLEVATFYTMFNLEPVGKFYIQLCGTTPCMLSGSDDLIKRARAPGRAAAPGDGRRAVLLARGRMPRRLLQRADGADQRRLLRGSRRSENFEKLLDDLAAGRPVKTGSQTGRVSSEPLGKLTSLASLYGEGAK